MKKPEKKGLGRGLSALMSDIDAAPARSRVSTDAAGTQTVPIEKVKANPGQPRMDFDESELNRLAKSISEKGIIQPIIVRPAPDGTDRFQIIAGERRWRAAQRAKLHEIPIILRDMSDLEVLEVAIIENVQRADLNPVEEALGYQSLMQSFGRTQDQLSQALGKSRSHIANMLRLLRLPESVLTLLRVGKLSIGHARALIPFHDPEGLAEKILAEKMSVRQVEAFIKAYESGQVLQPVKKQEKDSDTKAIEADLKAHLGMRVDIRHKVATGGGQVTVSYKSLEDLDRLCALLSSNDQGGTK